MARNKHFRKDVIIARIIFAVLCALLIAAVVLVVSLLSNPSHEDKDSQKIESQQEDHDEDSQQMYESEEVTVDSETESESESETEETVYYVVPVTEVRFRSQPDTGSTTIEKIPAGTKTILMEELDGWYYVEYNGVFGYISADYAEIVLEN